MIGAALGMHTVSAIFRREGTQLLGVIERMTDIIGSRNGYNGQDKIWRLGQQRIEFGSTPHSGDEEKYRGRAKDFLAFDEATGFLESQVRFLMGWVRTTIKGQKCRTLLTFNPPTSAEGQWIIAFFGPWLQRNHPNPAEPGELRYFAVINGTDTEVADKRPFVLVGDERVYDFDPEDFKPTEIITPQSRTFIPAKVSDNPFLMGTGYVTQLQAMPEPLRTQMLEGDFTAGLEDNEWQVIPSAWVEAAQDRWSPREAKSPMDSMGVDVSRGGRDETIISRRHGTWFDELVTYPGTASPDGPTVASYVVMKRRDNAPVHIDVVGWGASPYDFLDSNQIHTIPVNGASGSYARSEEGNLEFANLRAEIWWRMREALNPLNPAPIALPPCPKLKADLCAPLWSLKQQGILVESKEDIKKRLGRSPDRGDAVCLANMNTPKEDPNEQVQTQCH